MDDRTWRDRIEAAQAETKQLRQALVDAQFRAAKAEVEVAMLRALLESARLEQDRLAGLLVGKAVNPEGQTSAFGVDQVARLMAFLKNS